MPDRRRLTPALALPTLGTRRLSREAYALVRADVDPTLDELPLRAYVSKRRSERVDLSDADGVFTIDGKRYVWPQVRVARRMTAAGMERPDLELQIRAGGDGEGEGEYLAVVMEEDGARREEDTPGALPLDAEVESIALEYQRDGGEVMTLQLEHLVQTKLEGEGAAFRVEAEVALRSQEERDRVMSALRGAHGWRATWSVSMFVLWHWRDRSSSHGRRPGPATLVPILRQPVLRTIARPARPARTGRTERVVRPARVVRTGRLLRRAAPTPIVDLSPALRARLLSAEHLLDAGTLKVLDGVSKQNTERFSIRREEPAFFPDDVPENKPIYAAITGDYAGLLQRWIGGAAGLFQTTAIRGTVYCVPDSYRLSVDPSSGLPAIKAVLLPPSAGDDGGGSGSPRTRLIFDVEPYFDPERMDRLRALIRDQSHGAIPFAHLVLGGYAGARFCGDESLVGLGTLFSGTGAEGEEGIDPVDGFTVTYEGDAEYIAEIVDRLAGDREHAAIGGHVELDLREPDEKVRKERVPVRLWLDKMASLELPVTFADGVDGAGEDADDADDEKPVTTQLRVQNPTELPVHIDGLAVQALQVSRYTRVVEEAYPARVEGADFPLRLEPGAAHALVLSAEDAEALYNAWHVQLLGARAELAHRIMLTRIFDLSAERVHAWTINVTFLPFAYWDDLTDEDRAGLQGTVAVDVELRRQGSRRAESVRLDKRTSSIDVRLAVTLSDYLHSDEPDVWAYEHRKRLLRATGPQPWSQWTPGFGPALALGL